MRADRAESRRGLGPVQRALVGAAVVAGIGAVLAVPWSCEKPPEDDGPPLEGACGMEGQRVWCNYDGDCRDGWCASNGVCGNIDQGPVHCESYFRYCRTSLGYICSGGDCRRPCRSHADCTGGGACLCINGMHICSYKRCGDGLLINGELGCTEGTSPIEGSLICRIDNLEGSCHNVEACEAGYERVGEEGCVPLYDCGNGVQEPGEDCDGTDLGGATCESVGLIPFPGAELRCRDDCGFDVTLCY